jgi:hypothetical protein
MEIRKVQIALRMNILMHSTTGMRFKDRSLTEGNKKVQTE